MNHPWSSQSNRRRFIDKFFFHQVNSSLFSFGSDDVPSLFSRLCRFQKTFFTLQVLHSSADLAKFQKTNSFTLQVHVVSQQTSSLFSILFFHKLNPSLFSFVNHPQLRPRPPTWRVRSLVENGCPDNWRVKDSKEIRVCTLRFHQLLLYTHNKKEIVGFYPRTFPQPSSTSSCRHWSEIF